MARDAASHYPVQVCLNTEHLISRAETRQFGGGYRDFFANNNRGFKIKKEKVCSSLHRISDTLRKCHEPAGFVRIQVRTEAFAKSYRPTKHLFTEAHGFTLVGTDRIGEMIFQTTPQALDELGHAIEQKAEPIPVRRRNGETGEIEYRISGYRSEVGALEEIDLHDATNRIAFSIEDAIAWLQQPNAMGAYLVELFRPRPSNKIQRNSIDALAESFHASLLNLPCGVIAHPFLSGNGRVRGDAFPLVLSVRLVHNPKHRKICLPFGKKGKLPESYKQMPGPSSRAIKSSLNPVHHQALLEILAKQPLVRRIHLPPVLEEGPDSSIEAQSSSPDLPAPKRDTDYPVVGIIDGGIAEIPGLADWKAGEAGLIPSGDRDECHGTFIAGLVATGAAINPHISDSLEPQGCKFFDLDIFPRRDLRGQYFGGDLSVLFDQLDESVKFAKQTHNVRIFNFSFGLQSPSPFKYSIEADFFDRMARAHDVIFVISSGNLHAGESRFPWPTDPNDVTEMLARSSFPQNIVPPAEHLLGVTVGAINPPGINGHHAEFPTTYTRRGPGVGGARKPDLAHFGGIEKSADTNNRTGLQSLSPDGDCIENCGTSYANPNASAMLATLDYLLEHKQPREVLLALPAHRARRADALDHSKLRHISREFVGFGLPPSARTLLLDDPFSISLVFTHALEHRQRMEFKFPWPAELVDAETSACRGKVDLTLAFTPPIDHAHGAEAMRVQLDAHLHQEAVDYETGEIKWESRLTQDGSGLAQGMNKTERYMLMAGLKWSPIKRYHAKMPRGRGRSSNWRLTLESLTRVDAPYPDDGVPFAIIMTISDIQGETPIHDSVCNALKSQGLSIADIALAHRIRIQQK